MRFKILNIYCANGALVNVKGYFHITENTDENTVTIHSQDREITFVFKDCVKSTCISYTTNLIKSGFTLTYKTKEELEKELNEFYG